MKLKFPFLLFFLLLFVHLPFIPETAKALSPVQEEKLIQQIEILKQEVFVLKSLLLNLQSQEKISARAYLAVNLSDNSVVLGKNQNQPYSIASVTKLMSALIAVENIDKGRTITLTEQMLKPLGQSPALFPGLAISAENLIKAALIQSANDAPEALAYFLGKEKFLVLMNRKAKELNMANTVFYDVSGLNPANRSNAADIAKLISYIYKNHPEILSITRDNNFWLPDQTGKMVKFYNVNNFYPVPEFIGGKTGYLAEARQTLASVFNVSGKPIAIVILYSNNRQADAFSILKQLGY